MFCESRSFFLAHGDTLAKRTLRRRRGGDKPRQARRGQRRQPAHRIEGRRDVKARSRSDTLEERPANGSGIDTSHAT
ncbi:hypothetical protein PQG83_19440 [Candidatus Nitrospira neomarina]|uniref:Uncharacterized protein n=1 Tax=Candidatus Nitrospira neomarina TaxID=3020899 RepID=A0AA96GJ38_9BACT|nr:hypothetical protein [Candidatus Nitrospira neomarina]WNM61892.1 hypothetical protein PQG83_19440 [Candidatus Nitrospira neomarina]